MMRTLMRAKLHRQRVDRPLVARPELVQRIQASTDGDVTTVVAPAGYGKTTIITQWAAQTALPVAWFSIDDTDNDLVQFLSYLAAAIQTIFPDACMHLLELLDRLPLPDMEHLAAVLSNEVDAVPQRFVLVLDDYHCVTEPAIQQLLNELLRHPLHKMHLVISSRSQPTLALARLRGNRRLAELHTQDLRLTYAEAEALLAQTAHSSHSSREVSTLLVRTEGWMTGAHLVALALGKTEDFTALLGEQGNRIDRYTSDYLFEQVLLQQSPLVRDFLLKTSILERLSPSLAEAVIGSSHDRTGISLGALARAGLFLNAVDDVASNAGEWYSYHLLFRSVLRHQLEATASYSEIAVLHRRASAWYCQNGFFDEALQHAFAAGDTQLALQIVIDHFTSWLEWERWRTIERRINLLPADLLDRHPWLLMARAHILALQFKWHVLQPLLTRAEQQLDRDNQLAPAQERLLRSYLDVLWALHWSSAYDAPKAIEAAQRALHVLPVHHYYARGVLQLALTLSLQASGQVELAEQMLTAALAQAELAPPGSLAPLRPLLCLATIYFTEGDVVSAAQASRILLQKAIETKSLFNQQIAHLAMGAAAYEMNDLESAVAHFRQGADLRHIGQVRAGHECLVGLALAYQALQRNEAVKTTLAQLADYHSEVASSALAAEAVSLQRRLGLISAGSSMHGVLRRSVPARMGIWYGWLEVPAITEVRLALADGQPRSLAQTETALNQLMALAIDLHKPSFQAMLLALKSVLLLQRRKEAAALEILRQAIILGEDRGLVRSIADAGPQLKPLLAELAILQPSAYVERIRAAANFAPNGVQYRQIQPAVGNLTAPITRREREVLNLLDQHRTDREIAETLVISPLTVRTHIENLSSKLSVHGRRAIVSRAREYGLLA